MAGQPDVDLLGGPVPEPTHPAVRASDAEREAVVAALQRAVGEGRLTADEAGDRIAAVYAARFRTELAGPLADLPDTRGPASATTSDPLSWEALWTQLIWRARVVLDGPAATRPTPRQQRLVAALTGLALLWTVIWVLLGASLA
jgi:hypothetical protein